MFLFKILLICYIFTFLPTTVKAVGEAQNGHAKSSDANVTFSRDQLQGVLVGMTSQVSMNVTGKFFNDSFIRIFSVDPDIARVVNRSFPVPNGCSEYCEFPVTFEVSCHRMTSWRINAFRITDICVHWSLHLQRASYAELSVLLLTWLSCWGNNRAGDAPVLGKLPGVVIPNTVINIPFGFRVVTEFVMKIHYRDHCHQHFPMGIILCIYILHYIILYIYEFSDFVIWSLPWLRYGPA